MSISGGSHLRVELWIKLTDSQHALLFSRVTSAKESVKKSVCFNNVCVDHPVIQVIVI